MSKRDKRLEALRTNPKHVRFDELRVVLEDCGFSVRPSKGHWAFSHPLLPLPFVVDPRRPFVLPVYVKNALRAIDQVQEQLEGGGD